MPTHDFDCQPVLHGSTLRLRPLVENDFDATYQAASDPGIWVGHPAKDRYKPEVFEAYFAALLKTKKSLAVIEADTGKIVDRVFPYRALEYSLAKSHDEAGRNTLV